MSPPLWTEIDQFLANIYVAPDEGLDAALAASAAAGLPAINVTPNQGKFLHLLARVLGARNILEIGTLGGYSTIWLARALPPGGRLITLEADPKCASIAFENLARAGLGSIVELRLGKALETLPILAVEARGPFDLIFIDADKENTPAYFDWALKLARRGSLVVVDNVVRSGAVLNPESSDASVQGIRQFHELVASERRASDPRFSATAIQTVGSKGHDGYAMVLVN